MTLLKKETKKKKSETDPTVISTVWLYSELFFRGTKYTLHF